MKAKLEQPEPDALAEVEHALAEVEHALSALSDRWAMPGCSRAGEEHALFAKLHDRSQLAAMAYRRAVLHLCAEMDHPDFFTLLGELARFEIKVLSLGCR